MELKNVLYEVRNGVGLITLNRPDRLNAWTGRMGQELRWCFTEADGDADVRVIVLTGAGRGFCAGADFNALDKMTDTGEYDAGIPAEGAVPIPAGATPDFAHEYSFMLGLRKPVIACVNGPAAGVGFVIMCYADIRFAASGAKLTTSFGRLGLPAEHGVSWMLARLIGPARAADLLFSSRVVLAEEALEMGLVNYVHPGADVLDAALAYARRMAAEISPKSLLTMKRQLWNDLLRNLDEAAGESEQLIRELIGGPDFREGVAAHQEKRSPTFPPLLD
jgi:enoyl-CoA hydratase/carnithine racemase